MRALRQPDDPGPADMPGFDPLGFNLPPPDRGSSPAACIAAPLIFLAIVAVGFAIFFGWLP